MPTLLERFLRYISFDTRADSHAGTTPSSPGQTALARALADELRSLGLRDVTVDEHAYVAAALPGRGAVAGAPTIALLAHLDTATEYPIAGVKPRVVDNYDGGIIELGAGLSLDPDRFPVLRDKKGKTLVVTDGTTLLGGDDKAGMAAIMTVLDELARDPERPHPPLRVAFTPDEEIGHGASLLDIAALGADFAYTVDGGEPGVVEYETFNAAKAKIVFTGVSIHPGSAKDRMVNAVLLGQEFLDGLPAAERPENTEGRQGFYHVSGFSGDVSTATLELLVRDHDADAFAGRKQFLLDLAGRIDAEWAAKRGGGPYVAATVEDQYRNMAERVRPVMHIVDSALAACRQIGVAPCVKPVRGGTDGSQLSWRGLPTPNLPTGGYNMHGPFEFVVVEEMQLTVALLHRILALYAAHPEGTAD